MTLQQMRYIDAVASCGSISEAARRMFVTQPTLTEAIRSFENELKTAVFTRSSRGVTLTREGEELLASMRQILADVTLMREKYTGKPVRLPKFSVSCQHYAFAVKAFVDTAREHMTEMCDFSMRETVTSEIFDDVTCMRSEVGVVYLSNRNTSMLEGLMRREGLQFTPLYVSKPLVYLSKTHPLASKTSIRPEELDPYPFISFDQGDDNAQYFSEEVMTTLERKKNIRVCDRATMTNLIYGLDGFTVCSSMLLGEFNGDKFKAIPLEYDDEIRVGFLVRSDRSLSQIAKSFIAAAKRHVASYLPADCVAP